MLQFVCECDVVKDTGKEEYLRPFIHIGLDWIGNRHSKSQLILNNVHYTSHYSFGRVLVFTEK